MAVPDYQTLMLPVLRHVALASAPVRIGDIADAIAAEFGMTEDDLAERLPSGRQSLFHNRLHWAKTYLTRAGLIELPKRGHQQITERGRALLAENLQRIDNGTLKRFPEFIAWVTGTSLEQDNGSNSFPVAASANRTHEETLIVSAATPEERIGEAQRELQASLKADLLERIRAMPPGDFESLIIHLLVKMGYGLGKEEMAKALGGSSDGGIDGVINQDALGLDRVYIQAKRYKDGITVGASQIRDFIGALNIRRANKGLFVTASTFTREAEDSARNANLHVVLVDGDRLAGLMIRHNVGVIVRDVVEIKSIDEGFFAE